MGRGHGLPGQKSEGIASVGPTLRGISQVAMGARCARYKSSPQRASRSRRESCLSRRSCHSRRGHAIQGDSDSTQSCGNVHASARCLNAQGYVTRSVAVCQQHCHSKGKSVSSQGNTVQGKTSSYSISSPWRSNAHRRYRRTYARCTLTL